MQIKNSTDRYGAVAQLLHWSVVALIVTQLALAYQYLHAVKLMEKAKLITTHKNIGMTVLALAVIRLIWRWANGAPASVPNMKIWQERTANFVHWLLYGLIFLTPLTGWLMSSAKNYTVSYFGWFSWPNLVAPNERLFEFFQGFHAVLGTWCIPALAILHILAALKHHFFDRDNTLRRMLPVKLK